jgi:hypothetical protein
VNTMAILRRTFDKRLVSSKGLVRCSSGLGAGAQLAGNLVD